MPRFDQDLEQQPLAGHFGFSHIPLKDLGAAEYTLVSIIVDESGSTTGFLREMEKCIQSIVSACKYSPRADNLLLRTCAFDHNFREIHGFNLLQNINLDDYKGCLNSGGTTSLFDAAHNAISASNAYGRSLLDQDFSVNGIVFVVTDGCDNQSGFKVSSVKAELDKAVTGENLESLVSVLIGVNVQDSGVSRALRDFETGAGFTKYIELDKADAKTLAKLAEFVSKSISSQSQSVGSGQAASLTF